MMDTGSLSPGLMTTVNIAVFVAFTVWNRLAGNKKADTSADRVIANTPSPGQVEALDVKIRNLEKQVRNLEEQLEKSVSGNVVLSQKYTETLNVLSKELSAQKSEFRKLSTAATNADISPIEVIDIPDEPIGKIIHKP